jgi:hypothetical protein
MPASRSALGAILQPIAAEARRKVFLPLVPGELDDRRDDLALPSFRHRQHRPAKHDGLLWVIQAKVRMRAVECGVWRRPRRPKRS